MSMILKLYWLKTEVETKTIEKGQELSKVHPELLIFHYHSPDYGLALKEGINRAKGEIVFCDEIDLCLPEFYSKALKLFEDEKNSDDSRLEKSRRCR